MGANVGAVYAMRVPSGDHAGDDSYTSPVSVTLRRFVPSTSIV